MILLEKSKYRVRIAQTDQDIITCQSLRFKAFGMTHKSGLDRDTFDPVSQHVMIEHIQSNTLVSCFRMALFPSAETIERSYAAQFYALERLTTYRGALLEIGRFCIAPDQANQDESDIIRTAWGALTRIVDENDIALLFGCSSFRGNDPAPFITAFETLRARHLAPKQWAPIPKAAHRVNFSTLPNPGTSGQESIPALLRTYILMGGWVSDHAVIDAELNTMHVFTGVEIAQIPETRKRLLRALT